MIELRYDWIVNLFLGLIVIALIVGFIFAIIETSKDDPESIYSQSIETIVETCQDTTRGKPRALLNCLERNNIILRFKPE